MKYSLGHFFRYIEIISSRRTSLALLAFDRDEYLSNTASFTRIPRAT